MGHVNRNAQTRQDFTAIKAERVRLERARKQAARDREIQQQAELMELQSAIHADNVAERRRWVTREYWVERGLISAKPLSDRSARIRAFAVPLDTLLADVKPMSLQEEQEFADSFRVFTPLSAEEAVGHEILERLLQQDD